MKSVKDLVRPKKDDSTPPTVTTHEEKHTKVRKERKPKEQKEGRERRPLKDLLKSKGFFGVLCIVAALLLAFVVVPLLQAQLAKTASVVVLACDVPVAGCLTEEMLAYNEMGAVGLPTGALYDMKDAVGQYLTVAGAAGDVLTDKRLSGVLPGDDPELAALPEGKMALSITLPELAQSVSGKLRAGDIIQLFAVQKDTTDESSYEALSVSELQRVEVLAVTNSAARNVVAGEAPLDATDTERLIATVTIAVNERQAQAVAGL
ncbi:MAG: RcpC/CpaB family pilus assembly protein, partial [Oscillospiraceae bacterium]